MQCSRCQLSYEDEGSVSFFLQALTQSWDGPTSKHCEVITPRGNFGELEGGEPYLTPQSWAGLIKERPGYQLCTFRARMWSLKHWDFWNVTCGVQYNLEFFFKLCNFSIFYAHVAQLLKDWFYVFGRWDHRKSEYFINIRWQVLWNSDFGPCLLYMYHYLHSDFRSWSLKC